MYESEGKKSASANKSGGVGRKAVGGWRMLVQVLMAVTLAGRIRFADATHASGMCVQLGQANANHLQHKSFGDQRRMGPWTIGTRKFDIIYDFLDFGCGRYDSCFEQDNNKKCPYTQLPAYTEYHVHAEPCVSQGTVELRTFAVKQDGKVMNGWLHFELELKDQSDHILAIYVQVRDEFFNAIGEFVSDPKEQCEPTNGDLVQPTEYQILPCSAVGFREAKVSNAIFMAEKNIFKKPDIAKNYIPEKSIGRGIHFTWRLSEYWCNRHLRFRPEATIFTQKILNAGKSVPPLIYRKAASYWFQPQWYGTADIKLPKTKLSCTDQVIDYNGNGELKKVAPWLHDRGVASVLGNDYFAQDQSYLDFIIPGGVQTIKSCQWNTRRQEPANKADEGKQFAKDLGPTFAGRCTHHYEKTPSHDALQGCNLNSGAEEFKDILIAYPNLETYNTYVNMLTRNRTLLCTPTCRVPTPDDIPDIKGFVDNTGEQNFTRRVNFNSDSRSHSRVERLLIGRKYHASLCIVWSMFLTPLSIFSARYFKETCMNVTCSGAHFWFWIHVATAVASVAVFVSSLSGIWSNLETWGRNQNWGGIAHMAVGYSSFSLFFLMMILGGFRPRKKRKRLVIMVAHSVLGFLIYFSNIAAMVVSFFIPGSPTIGNCTDIGFASDYLTKPNIAIFPIMIWVGIDILLHIAMTVMQRIKDKSIRKFKRRWYCPIIPMLPHDSADDFVGSSLRKITLMVYAAAAFILTSTTISLVMIGPTNATCAELTGNSSCTEKLGCSASAVSYSKKVNATSQITSGNYQNTNPLEFNILE